MKSIYNPSSKVSTQWVSLVPVHSKWKFTLYLHKHFTRPPSFLQLSSCNSYCIATCKQVGNIFIIFYPSSFLLPALDFTIVHMPQVILVSQFKSFWRVPQVWKNVSFFTADSWFLHCFICSVVESFCVHWLSYLFKASDFLGNIPWQSIPGHCTTSPIFSFRQSGPFRAPNTAWRQVQVLHTGCHQCAINATDISRPTTESRDEPVVLPQNWHTCKSMEDLRLSSPL